ncbi:hypothetical protein OIU78_019532 [Salix suchowensis]|nr:hypothetical protein OIU78_019532 [Salix suchowensis]
MAPEYGEKMSSRVQGVQETNRSEEIQAHGKVESTGKSVSPMHGEQSVHESMQQEDVHGFMQQEDVPYSEVLLDPMQEEVEATAGNWQVVRKKKEKQHSTAASHVHKVKNLEGMVSAGSAERIPLANRCTGDTSARGKEMQVAFSVNHPSTGGKVVDYGGSKGMIDHQDRVDIEGITSH